jgi:hypothetical protein
MPGMLALAVVSAAEKGRATSRWPSSSDLCHCGQSQRPVILSLATRRRPRNLHRGHVVVSRCRVSLDQDKPENEND